MTLALPIAGLTANELYHWRARLRYAPATVTKPGHHRTAATPPRAVATTARRSRGVRPNHTRWGNFALTSTRGTVAESDSTAVADLRMSTSDGALTLSGAGGRYATGNESALAGSDYTVVSGTVVEKGSG